MIKLKNKQPALPETKKKRLPFSVYLAYLLVCTFLVSGASFAKLTTTSAGNDTARAAAFVVNGNVTSLETMEGTLNLNGENPALAAYTITVTNQENGKVSEVAMDYTIQVKLKDGEQLPDGVSMKLIDASGNTYEASTDGHTYIFNKDFNLSAGTAKTDKYTLQFSAEGVTTIGNASSIDMDITAVVEQRD